MPSQSSESTLNVLAAARKVADMVGGDVGRWTLDGRRVTPEAGEALISLVAYLNDVSHLGLPPDLARVLQDQSIIVPQDAAVFDLIAKWANAPTNTASA